MRNTNILKCILLQQLLVAAVSQAYAFEQITDDIAISCKQSHDKQNLACDYRNKSAEAVISISADYSNNSLPVKEEYTYPNPDAVTAVLFLVDTSDPARQNVIDKNIEHIKTLLSSSEDHHRFGLASFDKELQLEVPIGSEISVINDAAKKLKAVGSTTELYRNMIEAIALFKTVDAARKSIFLFSDGLAEDQAYFHNDVVNAARKDGVIITTIGYPRSVSQSVSLQTLRRLSEETGGLFVEADYHFDIPSDFLRQPFISLDNGGKFNIQLGEIIENKVSGNNNINIKLESVISTTAIPVPVEFITLPVIQTPTTIIQQIPVMKEKQVISEPQTTTPIQIVSQTQRTNPLEDWLWYGIPVALFILMILTIATFFISLRRQNKNQVATTSYPEIKPYAYLITQDETKARYPITRTTCRLGRSKNNEITLRDTSVSRRHAEIHRDLGDEFTLVDLNSLNGVFVNNEKIGRYKLKEGDIIEIGDVNLRFSLFPTDHQIEESTVMQDTKVPALH